MKIFILIIPICSKINLLSQGINRTYSSTVPRSLNQKKGIEADINGKFININARVLYNVKPDGYRIVFTKTFITSPEEVEKVLKNN